jgi:hypothetical protein
MPAPLLSMAPMSGNTLPGDTPFVQYTIQEEEHSDEERNYSEPAVVPFDVYAAYQRHLRSDQVG